MKNTRRKVITMDEFRKNVKSGHPSYIYEKQGKKIRHFGITHAERTRGENNVKLDKNPDPQDSKTAYVRPTSKTDDRVWFSKILFGWELTAEDKRKIEKLKRESKEKNKKGR